MSIIIKILLRIITIIITIIINSSLLFFCIHEFCKLLLYLMNLMLLLNNYKILKNFLIAHH